MAQPSRRIIREQKTVQCMITLRCREHHGKDELCSDCARLVEYSARRLQKCPFQDGKTTCAKCPVHCYRPDMRQSIREVMRYAGPRMIYRHPVMALGHFLDSTRKKPVGYRPGK